MEWRPSPSGNSSVGRARPCQGRGREFESRFPLQFQRCSEVSSERKGRVAEWSCSGLQIRVRRFDSDLGLHMRKSCKSMICRTFLFTAGKSAPCGHRDVLYIFRPRRSRIHRATARMAKSVDAGDLKSLARKGMPVRVRLRAPYSSELAGASRCSPDELSAIRRATRQQSQADNRKQPRHSAGLLRFRVVRQRA